MKLTAFEISMREAIKHAHNSTIATLLQMILDASKNDNGTVHTNDGGSGQPGPPNN